MRVYRLLDYRNYDLHLPHHHQQNQQELQQQVQSSDVKSKMKLNFTHEQAFKQLEMNKLSKMRAKVKLQKRNSLSIISLQRSSILFLLLLSVLLIFLFIYILYFTNKHHLIARKPLNNKKTIQTDLLSDKHLHHVNMCDFNYGKFISDEYYYNTPSSASKLRYVDVLGNPNNVGDISSGCKTNMLSTKWDGLCIVHVKLWESVYKTRSCKVIPFLGDSHFETIVHKESVKIIDYLNVEYIDGHREIRILKRLLALHRLLVNVVSVTVTFDNLVDIEKVMEFHHYVYVNLNSYVNNSVALFIHPSKFHSSPSQNHNNFINHSVLANISMAHFTKS